MNDAAFTQMAAAELTARGIPFVADATESEHLGIPFVPDTAPAPAAMPAEPVETHAQIVERLSTPDLGLRGEAAALSAMGPPANAADYQIQGVTPGPNRDAVHAALADLQLPVGLGRHLVAIVQKGGSAPPAKPEEARVALTKSTQHLNRLWGVDAPARIAEVQAHVARVAEKHPWLPKALERSGAHRDSWMMIHLSNVLRAQHKS
jgi:hypothetical protein